MRIGYVTRLGARGFGFLQPVDGGPDVFFSYGECHLRDNDLDVGDRVQFELDQFAKKRGDRRACEVRRV